MARKTQKQIHEEEQARYLREWEARDIAYKAETAALLAENTARVDELADLMGVTLVECINCVYNAYTPKNPARFIVCPYVRGYSTGIQVQDECVNTMTLTVAAEYVSHLDTVDQCDINHSASGAQLLANSHRFADALRDMADLGAALQAKLAPLVAVYRDSKDSANKGPQYTDYRILDAAADKVAPVVYEYAKMKRTA